LLGSTFCFAKSALVEASTTEFCGCNDVHGNALRQTCPGKKELQKTLENWMRNSLLKKGGIKMGCALLHSIN
jgi:hypothetical protein